MVLQNLRLADLLLGNDLFQANSKLRDPIEIILDVSASPVMNKATSSESIDNQMSKTVLTSSDPIEIAAVTRSQSKHTYEADDGDTGPVTLSDETNRMLSEMDVTKFKEMHESDSSLNALWLKAKQTDSRYCISNDLLYERSRSLMIQDY